MGRAGGEGGLVVVRHAHREREAADLHPERRRRLRAASHEHAKPLGAALGAEYLPMHEAREAEGGAAVAHGAEGGGLIRRAP